MLVFGVWIIAGLALVPAAMVFRRFWKRSGSGSEPQSIGRLLLTSSIVGMMSLRIGAAFHKGFALTVPIAIVAFSLVVLTALGGWGGPE